MAPPMTSDDYKKEWETIQAWLQSPAHMRQIQAEDARLSAWMNLAFGMEITPNMTPDEMAAYFDTWNKAHGYPPFTPR